MTQASVLAVAPERRTRWLGAVAVFMMVMTPLLGYLAPLGFAPLLGLVGLLATPGLARSRPPLLPMLALVLLVLWALISLAWSPATPDLSHLKRDKDIEDLTALKLVLELGLYGSAAAALGTMSRRSARLVGTGDAGRRRGAGPDHLRRRRVEGEDLSGAAQGDR
jgi:O-antigen ligase